MMMTRMVMLESLENPFIIPLLINCSMDNPELISSRLPYPIQENETFIIDFNSLAHRKDIFCDDKRSRLMKGNREKLHSATNNSEGQVSSLCKDSSEADRSVRRHPYACKFCSGCTYEFRKCSLVLFMQQKLRVLHKTFFTGKIARKFTGPM